uniref:Small ribosomal subunit protein bS6 n=1 Tax=candidate division WWE3 bacterium TaxID=2053526 RepID=A0A831YYN6_UNCKA
MNYELTIALKPDLAAEKSKKIFAEVAEAVGKAGGKTEKVESLGVKNLAYPIKGLPQASFGRFQLEIEPANVNALRRGLEKEEDFLRVFVVEVKGGGKSNKF